MDVAKVTLAILIRFAILLMDCTWNVPGIDLEWTWNGPGINPKMGLKSHLFFTRTLLGFHPE